MIPLVSDVGKKTRIHLGDTQTSTGQIFIDASLVFLDALDMSYQELISRLSAASADIVERTSYFVLPAYTGVFSPSAAGITNFGQPEDLYERGSIVSHAISNATVNASIPSITLTLGTALPSWFVSGMYGDVYGVAGISADVNDSFSVTVTNSTTVELNGCTATGTFSGSAGKFIISSEDWSSELIQLDNDEDFPDTASSSFGCYVFKKGVFRLPNCSLTRELQIVYSLSGVAPTAASASLGIDDSLNFLAARTGQYCANSKGNQPKVAELKGLADYFLGVLLTSAARELQNGSPIIPPSWRPKRNIRQGIW